MVFEPATFFLLSITGDFWNWPGWSFFVAVGTLALAGVTYVLVRATRDSVTSAARQIEIERKRTEAAQWPRVFPAPSADWVGSTDRYSGEWSSRLLPVKNGGPGVALNVQADLDFTSQEGGTIIRTSTTSIASGDEVDLRLDWPNPPRSSTSTGTGVQTLWLNVKGRLLYQDLAGNHWVTNFTIETEGSNGYRRATVRETELVQRGDGMTLVPPESFDPQSWYTPA
jgi:hypothetical protein